MQVDPKNGTVVQKLNSEVLYLIGFFASLIPRLFPPSVFDCLQYANTEGEDLGDFITCGYVR